MSQNARCRACGSKKQKAESSPPPDSEIRLVLKEENARNKSGKWCKTCVIKNKRILDEEFMRVEETDPRLKLSFDSDEPNEKMELIDSEELLTPDDEMEKISETLDEVSLNKDDKKLEKCIPKNKIDNKLKRKQDEESIGDKEEKLKKLKVDKVMPVGKNMMIRNEEYRAVFADQEYLLKAISDDKRKRYDFRKLTSFLASPIVDDNQPSAPPLVLGFIYLKDITNATESLFHQMNKHNRWIVRTAPHISVNQEDKGLKTSIAADIVATGKSYYKIDTFVMVCESLVPFLPALKKVMHPYPRSFCRQIEWWVLKVNDVIEEGCKQVARFLKIPKESIRLRNFSEQIPLITDIKCFHYYSIAAEYISASPRSYYLQFKCTLFPTSLKSLKVLEKRVVKWLEKKTTEMKDNRIKSIEKPRVTRENPNVIEMLFEQQNPIDDFENLVYVLSSNHYQEIKMWGDYACNNLVLHEGELNVHLIRVTYKNVFKNVPQCPKLTIKEQIDPIPLPPLPKERYLQNKSLFKCSESEPVDQNLPKRPNSIPVYPPRNPSEPRVFVDLPNICKNTENLPINQGKKIIKVHLDKLENKFRRKLRVYTSRYIDLHPPLGDIVCQQPRYSNGDECCTDAAIVSDIVDLICDYPPVAGDNTIFILSGDGDVLVGANWALQMGWEVEIYYCGKSLSPIVYNLAERYPGKVQKFDLALEDDGKAISDCFSMSLREETSYSSMTMSDIDTDMDTCSVSSDSSSSFSREKSFKIVVHKRTKNALTKNRNKKIQTKRKCSGGFRCKDGRRCLNDHSQQEQSWFVSFEEDFPFPLKPNIGGYKTLPCNHMAKLYGCRYKRKPHLCYFYHSKEEAFCQICSKEGHPNCKPFCAKCKQGGHVAQKCPQVM